MFNGELKSIVDANKLNISLLQNVVPFFKDKDIVCNIHDCSLVNVKDLQFVCSLILPDAESILDFYLKQVVAHKEFFAVNKNRKWQTKNRYFSLF